MSEQTTKRVPVTVQYPPPKAVVPLMDYEHSPAPITGYAVALIAVRALAVLILGLGCQQLAAAIPYLMAGSWGSWSGGGEAFFFLVGALLMLVLPVGLWLAAPPLARMMVPTTQSQTGGPLSRRPDDLMALALSVVGVYLFAQALPAMVWIIIAMSTGNGRASNQMGPVVQGLFGVLLFFGGSGLAKFWQRLRRPNPFRGQEQPSEESSTTEKTESTDQKSSYP